jgi:uncharacterized protein (DUF1778 family)
MTTEAQKRAQARYDAKRLAPVSVRLNDSEKAVFQEAAAIDGKSLGTWLKHLARQRVEELRRRGSLRSKEGGADNA